MLSQVVNVYVITPKHRNDKHQNRHTENTKTQITLAQTTPKHLKHQYTKTLKHQKRDNLSDVLVVWIIFAL